MPLILIVAVGQPGFIIGDISNPRLSPRASEQTTPKGYVTYSSHHCQRHQSRPRRCRSHDRRHAARQYPQPISNDLSTVALAKVEAKFRAAEAKSRATTFRCFVYLYRLVI